MAIQEQGRRYWREQWLVKLTVMPLFLAVEVTL
jgi:hypothetical protein